MPIESPPRGPRSGSPPVIEGYTRNPAGRHSLLKLASHVLMIFATRLSIRGTAPAYYRCRLQVVYCILYRHVCLPAWYPYVLLIYLLCDGGGWSLLRSPQPRQNRNTTTPIHRQSSYLRGFGGYPPSEAIQKKPRGLPLPFFDIG